MSYMEAIPGCTEIVSRTVKDGPPTDKKVEMFDPVLLPPPRNELLPLANPGGVLIKGYWTDDCIAWMYHPVIPQSVKDRQSLSLLEKKRV